MIGDLLDRADDLGHRNRAGLEFGHRALGRRRAFVQVSHRGCGRVDSARTAARLGIRRLGRGCKGASVIDQRVDIGVEVAHGFDRLIHRVGLQLRAFGDLLRRPREFFDRRAGAAQARGLFAGAGRDAVDGDGDLVDGSRGLAGGDRHLLRGDGQFGRRLRDVAQRHVEIGDAMVRARRDGSQARGEFVVAFDEVGDFI